MSGGSTAHQVIITGANGVLGRSIARWFLQHDPSCKLWLGVRANRDHAEAIVTESAGRAQLLELDVTSESAWQAAVEQVPGITTLINNAGFHDDTLLANMSNTQWTSVLDSCLNSVFLGCRAVIKPMAAGRFGRIVNVASLSALHAPAGQTNYAAAKAGVLALTQSLAKETARLGITVNAVCPAHIEGALPTNWSADQLTATRKALPMRRFARPDEVAAAIFFLASPEASYITGTALKVDGGLT